jgi:hypothetical protein
MTTSPSSLSAQDTQRHRISGWVRSLTLRRIGSLVLLLALLVTSATFLMLCLHCKWRKTRKELT